MDIEWNNLSNSIDWASSCFIVVLHQISIERIPKKGQKQTWIEILFELIFVAYLISSYILADIIGHFTFNVNVKTNF